jgi:hypothetical protein
MVAILRKCMVIYIFKCSIPKPTLPQNSVADRVGEE